MSNIERGTALMLFAACAVKNRPELIKKRMTLQKGKLRVWVSFHNHRARGLWHILGHHNPIMELKTKTILEPLK